MNVRWKIAQFAEYLWWKWYLKSRNVEDYTCWKKEYWSGFLKELRIEPTQGRDICDIGCGPAGIFMVLPTATSLIAIDPLLKSYGNLKHFNRRDYHWVEFEAVSLENFETRRRFDLIFCLNAINHTSSVEHGLAKIMNLLRQGGTIILSTDIHRNAFLKGLFRLLPGDILHPQQHDLMDYMRMINKAGGNVVRTFLYKRELIFDYQVFIIEKRNE